MCPKPGNPPTDSILEKVTLRSAALESHRLIFQGVDENPIGLNLTISTTQKLSSQRMIFIFRRQRHSRNQEIKNILERKQLLSSSLHPFHLLLKL